MKRILPLLPLFFFLCACNDKPVVDGDRLEVKSWIEQPSQTKTSMGGQSGDNWPVSWSPTDRIMVACNGAEAEFVTGADKIATGGMTTVFSGKIPSAKTYSAIYPSSQFKDFNAASSLISFSRPAFQQYVADGFAEGEYTAVASGKESFVFKNLFGIVRLNVLGSATVERISLTDTASEVNLWGDFTVRSDFGMSVPEVLCGDFISGHNEVNLRCGGVTLSPTTPTAFHFILPPGALTKGFVLRFYDAAGGVVGTYTSVKGCTVQRSKLTNVPTINLEGGSLSRVFDLLDLDCPGMETVKEKVNAGMDAAAQTALLEYFRARVAAEAVKNPDIDLSNRISYLNKNVADQAVAHRFYTMAYYESGSGSSTVYYCLDRNGKIDWDMIPSGVSDATEFNKQIHRLLFMTNLAQAGYIDDSYVRTVIDLYDDYISKYPCPAYGTKGTGIPYTGLQLSEKLSGWKNVLVYIAQSPKVTAEWLSKMLVYFHDVLECMRNTWYTAESNIHLEQVQALCEFALSFPEYANASTWLEEGMSMLDDELSVQFNGDGVGIDLDPSYHMGVVENFRHVKVFATLNGKSSMVSPTFNNSLRNSCEFVKDVVYPDYTCDNFNDTRFNSMSSRVVLHNFQRYSEMFPNDKEMQWMATNGASGTRPSDCVQIYATSGYYMMRTEWGTSATMLVHKNNANPRNQWHCQPDNGTFSIWKGGRRFLPDAGSYSYTGSFWDGSDRSSFAATKMHNTVTFNEAPIAKNYMNGEFVASNSRTGYEVLVTKNQSYANLTHLRAIFMVDRKFFVIVDEASGNASGKVNLNMNLCADPGGSLGTNASVIDDALGAGVYGAHTVFTDGNNMLYRTFTGTTEGFSAKNSTCYYSDAIGSKTQRRRYQVDLAKTASSTARFITVIYPFGKVSEIPDLAVSASFADAVSPKVNVSVAGKSYVLEYSR